MEHSHVFITVADGTRLAARLWLPDVQPAPVVLEALPYRMDDLTSSYTAEYERLCRGGRARRLPARHPRHRLLGRPRHRRVHRRGARRHLPGDRLARRAGVVERARRHVRHVVVGLQLAPGRLPRPARARRDRPDLRVGRPLHRRRPLHGRCREGARPDRLAALHGRVECPPARARRLRRRLARGMGDDGSTSVEPWLLRWFEEQTDGPYWRHGSVRPDYERITCPTMIVAGWADGYTNIAFRGFEALTCPKRVILGPWGHGSTATARPGPHIDLVPELIRWFRRWLADEENGVDTEPPIAVFARRSTRPAPDLAEMHGEWRSEATWPPERLDRARAAARGRGQRDDPRARRRRARRLDLLRGWRALGAARAINGFDDALSLAYDWDLSEADLDVMGHPRVKLTLTSPVPVAYLSVRLCDVFPDGASALAGRGDPQPHAPQRAHRAGRARARRTDRDRDRARGDLVGVRAGPPGAARARRSRLAEHLAAAERCPAPGRARQRRAHPPRARRATAAARPEPAADDGQGHARAGQGRRATAGRLACSRTTSSATRPAPSRAMARSTRRPSEPTSRSATRERSGCRLDDPALAWARATTVYRITWPEADVRTEARLEMRSDADAYHVVIDLVAEEIGPAQGGEPFRRERRFERRFPRHLA